MSRDTDAKKTNSVVICALASSAMAYGWGYRGIVGHEGGAMVPGAMLGMALCLGSGRPDWYRRAAVAGLLGAVGWAWGGSLSYMEHTLYAVSDSLPDVLYGYTMLFFLGALWAGIGGAILGLAFTERRSQLQRFVGPFTAVSAAFLLTYMYLLASPETKFAYEVFTVNHFHDGDWLPALTVLIVSAAYWLVRVKDRPATALFFWASAAWWIGYLGFTKFGGLRLAPTHRSESWGGVVGILVMLIIYLARRKNRAALMLCLYGILGGGAAFAIAVFIRHPVYVRWGPFASWGGMMQWKIAEESFGLLMALAIASGALRLLRGGLVPPEEDEPGQRLDVYSVFVMLIALMWVNLRRAPMRLMKRNPGVAADPLLDVSPWLWYAVAGALLTLLGLYVLNLYRRGDRSFVPQSAFGKGAGVFFLLLWVPIMGALVQEPPNPNSHSLLVHAGFWIPAFVATWIVLASAGAAGHATVPAGARSAPSDPKWRVGPRYGFLWAMVPVLLLTLTTLSMAMQEEPLSSGRLRFGPEAHWRQVKRLVGTWAAVQLADSPGDEEGRSGALPVRTIEFTKVRGVVLTPDAGDVEADVHAWYTKNQHVWIHWNGKGPDQAKRHAAPILFDKGRLYVPWPPDGQQGGYLVLERVEG